MCTKITRYYWGVGMLVTRVAGCAHKLRSITGAMVVLVMLVWPSARKSITGVIVVGPIRCGQVRRKLGSFTVVRECWSLVWLNACNSYCI